MISAALLGRVSPPTALATPAGSTPVPHQVFTTRDLAAPRQFEAWRALAVPYLDITAPADAARGGFDASAATLRFGPFLLYAATLPPYDHARSARSIRRDSLDHWLIAICRRGLQRQRSGETLLTLRPGIPYVLSMARPFEAQRSGEEIDWLTLHVARDAVPELEAALSAALYAPLDSAAGLLLADFLGRLRDGLDGLQPGDLPHLATATQALLTAAVHHASGPGAPQVEQIQIARLRRLVRDNLGAARLRPGHLAGLAGMSRSQLYRLFEPMGGVAHYIQRERLRQVRRCLSDPSERRDIATLAEAAGFFDPSSFSRAFRREFGCTPRELRLTAMAGGVTTPAVPAQDGILGMLRDL